ncbi:hypothetical protein FQR65_LT04754 [Abscondita terminalis]|nr:hypothetical protein FQR65_LT04754 [Abscondita terminalis]
MNCTRGPYREMVQEELDEEVIDGDADVDENEETSLQISEHETDTEEDCDSDSETVTEDQNISSDSEDNIPLLTLRYTTLPTDAGAVQNPILDDRQLNVDFKMLSNGHSNSQAFMQFQTYTENHSTVVYSVWDF